MVNNGGSVGVLSGGAASATIVNSGGIQFVRSGGSASSATVASRGIEAVYGTDFSATLNGGTQSIYSGGTVTGDTVSSGGFQHVWSGGSAVGTVLWNGGQQIVDAVSSGTQYVLSGGTASATTVYYGGNQAVFGGQASSTVLNGGAARAFSGGVIVSGIVNGGGFETPLLGGTTIATIVNSGGVEYVSSGGVASGTTVGTGGLQQIQGGLASGTIISGGKQEIDLGSASSTTIWSGAEQDVYGTATDTNINGGGTRIAFLLGQTSATIIHGGGTETVSSGGTANASIIFAGGIENVAAGGTVSGTKFIGGTQNIGAGATVSGENVVAGAHVLSGGIAVATILGQFGVQNLFSGGTASGTIFSGGRQNILSGASIANVSLSSGTQNVSSGATASNTTVLAGGDQVVVGGQVSSTLLIGGIESTASGGMAVGTTVGSGSVEYVSSGGLSLATTVSGGGVQQVQGGIASGTILSGGIQRIAAGSAIGTTIGSGGEQDVYATAANTTVANGGTEIIFAGQGNSTTVSSGGTELVSSGGTAISTVLSSGGVQAVNNGATVSGTTVSIGGLEVVVSGGAANATTVLGGGVQIVGPGFTASAGGTASGTIIGSGGTQFVEFGGEASSTVIGSGGVQIIGSGGTASAAMLGSGAEQFISSGAIVSGTIFGGTQRVLSGGHVGGAVLAGGIQSVSSGGTTSGTTIASGGYELVQSGGSGIDTTISGGTLELASGGTLGSEVVTFAGNAGTLGIDGTSMPSAVISGFSAGDDVELRTVGYGGWQRAADCRERPSLRVEFRSSPELRRDAVPAFSRCQWRDSYCPRPNHGRAFGPDCFKHHGRRCERSERLRHDGQYDRHQRRRAGPVRDGCQWRRRGGSQRVESGGTAINTVLNDPGVQTVLSGGFATGAKLSGGRQDIFGTANGTSVGSGGLLLVERGGSVNAVTVASGGIAYVAPGGLVSGRLLKGGIEVVFGSASASVVASGGALEVAAGGTARGTTVGSGSLLAAAGLADDVSISSGGSAEVLSGGVFNVRSGNTIYGTIVTSGGVATVYSGGTANGTVISAGATEIVNPGGTTTGTRIIGGTFELVNVSNAVSGPINFVGGIGTLRIDGTLMPSNVINGLILGETIDLAGVSFSSSGSYQLKPGNVLQITENESTYSLRLDPTETLSQFQLLSDGASGTTIKMYTPPLVTASNQVLSHGQARIAASNLFTATDPAGDTLTEYALWDTGSGGGHFALNGVAQGVNQEIDVTAAQLSQLTYQSGSGADTLWVRAYDGFQWSAWSNSFTMTGPGDNPPVVAVSNGALATGRSAAASSLFSAKDPDGDSISTYALWDSTGSGHFTVNGVTQRPNAEIDVTAAQLAQTTYVAGAVQDQLWFRANDGSQWSAWQGLMAGPTPPVVAVSNGALATGRSVAASSLFSAKDPDGDSIVTYALWDSTGSGQFAINGVTQRAGFEIDVTPSQLAQTTYVAGAVPDQLWFRANDGSQWSAWQSLTAGPTPPVMMVSSGALGSGRSVPASSLFSASDPDGDSIATYALWDSTGSGHFAINGVTQRAGFEIDVTAAQLAQTTYVAGPVPDQLWFRANDGSQWSAWQSLVAGPTPPMVSVANLTATHYQTLAASALLTANDPDGETVTTYALWNKGTGGGHFVLNGVAQGTNQEIDATAAQLSQLSYQSGSGADTLWVRAYDSFQWSAWSNSFTVTAPLDSGPVETVSNVMLRKGQSSIAASNLLTTSDSDGDAVAKYAFWDLGTGGGHFLINGVAQGTNQEIDVPASQLAQVTYQVGAAADTIWARSNDGIIWGSWSQSFAVSPWVQTPPDSDKRQYNDGAWTALPGHGRCRERYRWRHDHAVQLLGSCQRRCPTARKRSGETKPDQCRCLGVTAFTG
jgi:autotransporter passenger strand-loop-strand repeat protein